uniref:Uncharacterized protein n=1 Tax=Tetradesmus obliquus TaxID=3088 RepID=A0A383WHK5_TETOB|eukprot:jgi/Sobl393_1/8301/SZX76938.1
MDSQPDASKPGNSSGGKHRLLPFRLHLPIPGIPIPGLRTLGRLTGIGGGSSRPSSSTPASATATFCPAAASGGAGALAAAAAAAPKRSNNVATKPVSDVFAGALARALSQSTIHPLDTLKVRMQAAGNAATSAAVSGGAAAARAAPPAASVRGLSKFGQLVPPPVAGPDFKAMSAGLASLYRGVVGAASGAGIAIGAYFACYGVACNVIATHTDLSPSAVAFVSGGVAAAGSSVVKVPLAVCIRSVQAGVYPNVFAAASSITAKAGARGLFTGFFPTLLEDVPDMAVKFAAYESLRQLHKRANNGRNPSPQEDFGMGAFAGALAAASTTPLDVIKTRMMCAAAQRPTMASAARDILAVHGPKGFLTGIGARALSNGINSAVFFCFFEAIRSGIQTKAHLNAAAAISAWAAQAQERAYALPRMIGTSLQQSCAGWPYVLRQHGGGASGASSAKSSHLHWATAGAGGGLALLAGAAGAGRGLQGVLPGGGMYCGADEAELLLCGGPVGVDCGMIAVPGGGREGMAPLSLSLLARASPLRLEDSQLVMAVQALKSVEDSTNISLDEE